MRRKAILGVGAPLVDIVRMVDEDFLKNVPGGKGGTLHVDLETTVRLTAGSGDDFEPTPGGMAGNTLFALASFGVPAAMLGKTGDDGCGEFFRREFEKCGGDSAYLFSSAGEPTGRCVLLVTPDGERTMRSCLGASVHLNASDVEKVDFSRFELVYFEGFCLENPALEFALSRAKRTGCVLALDLASFETAEMFRGKLSRLLPEYFDIVFANADEATAFTGERDPEKSLAKLMRLCPLAAVKMGGEGSLVGRDGRIYRIAPAPAEKVIDTTGAGDWWAAGFLYGHFEGKDTETCGRLASLAGAAAVEVRGAKLPAEKLRKLMEKMRYGL